MTDDPLIGQILLGKLEVIGRLGGGGMGVVYEVEHRLTGHRRALKVVHSKFADRPRFMKRLLREAKVAGTLATSHVVETYDAGRLEDGSAYILMELLRGRSLYEALMADGPFEPRRLAEIMVQVAEAMSLAHAAGIIHRDLKPENIFLVETADADGVKVLDFGVSKFEDASAAPTRLTADGTLVGTPYYMSPEQASGDEVDARSDVYAMGVMMYEALCGRLPYEAASVGELFVRIGAGQHIPIDVRAPGLDPRWVEVVERAFARDPTARHPSAEALRQDLLGLLDGGSVKAHAKTISDRPKPMTRPVDPKEPPRDSDEALLGPADEEPARVSTPAAAERPESKESIDAPSPAEGGPARAAPGGRFPAWGGALVGVAALALLGWFMWPPADGAPPAARSTQTRTDAPPTEPAPATDLEEPQPAPAPTAAADAGAALAADGESPTPATRRRTSRRAAPTGLDPNPYR